MTGATLVMPGAKLDGASIYELLDTYKVTFTAAVPTVWLMLLQHLEATGGKLPHLKRVVIGGSACPRAMTKTFQDKYGVEVIHAWGMTEMSPLGTLCTMKPEYAELTGEARLDIQMKQGHPPFGVEMKITDDARPRAAVGRQDLRPPQGARARGRARLFQGRQRSILDAGRLLRHRRRRDHRPARLHADHRPLQGRDQVGRRMDFLDRPGEPRGRPSQGRRGRGDRRPASEMGRAAAAGRRAQEGPVAPRKDEILGFMQGKIAKWWMPDDVVFVDEIPHTATGKIQKTELRERFKDYMLPTRDGVNGPPCVRHCGNIAVPCRQTFVATQDAPAARIARLKPAEAATAAADGRRSGRPPRDRAAARAGRPLRRADRRAFWRTADARRRAAAVTLGIYRFWLATDIRRFLWSNTEIAGDSLEYTGTATRAAARLSDRDRAPGADLCRLLHRRRSSSAPIGELAGAAGASRCWPCSASSRSIARAAIASPAPSIAACASTRPARPCAMRSARCSGGR